MEAGDPISSPVPTPLPSLAGTGKEEVTGSERPCWADSKAKGSEGNEVSCCGVDIGTFQRDNLVWANLYSLNFPRKKSRGTTHPGRALGSRPGCPGLRTCHYTWSPLWPVDRDRIQSGRPDLCHSCGNRVPMDPRSSFLAAAGTAAAHSAGSECLGPHKIGSHAEGLTPCRIECGPGFPLRKRQSSRTRRTTMSSLPAL